MTWKSFYRPLIICILIAHAAGLSGLIASPDAWYEQLDKPEFQPSGSVFAPVWLALYTLIGISLFMIWQKRQTINFTAPAVAFAAQWILNFSWTILFFGSHNPGAALVDILLLLLVIFIMMIMYSRISPLAGLLLVPYFLWTVFAMFLNLSIWELN